MATSADVSFVVAAVQRPPEPDTASLYVIETMRSSPSASDCEGTYGSVPCVLASQSLSKLPSGPDESIATAMFVAVAPPSRMFPDDDVSEPLFQPQYLYGLPQGSFFGAPLSKGTQPPFPDRDVHVCGSAGSVRASPSPISAASWRRMPRPTRISDLACSMRLTSTIVERGPRIVAIIPAPRTPTTATAPNKVKNTLPRSPRLAVSFLLFLGCLSLLRSDLEVSLLVLKIMCFPHSSIFVFFLSALMR